MSNKKEKEQEDIQTDINSPFELEKSDFPLLSVKSTVVFSASTVNHFFFSIGLFLFMYMKFNWLHSKEDPANEKFYYFSLLFTGIVQYIIGFYDWYRGRTISFTLDFVFGLLYALIYFNKYDEGLLDFPVTLTVDNCKMGTFYAIFAGFLLVLTAGCKNRGLIYLVDIFALFGGFVFLFIFYFWNINWCRITAQIFFVVVSCLFWLTGLGNLINDVFQKKIIPFLEPAI